MRYLYTVLLYLAMPIVLVRLLWRSRRQPAYRQRLQERFGFYTQRFDKCLWVHAVSMGETIASVPLVKALAERYPELPIVMTTMTPTGAEQVVKLLGDKVTHMYLPYDLPDAIARFLKVTNPIAAIMMETELWPNMFAACYQRHIPISIVNARLSEKSARGYARIKSLTHEMLSNIHLIAAHEAEDAKRFIELGAPLDRVQVTGSIKFDLIIPPEIIEKAQQLREEISKERFVWIAASTHEGEESIVLAAHKKLREHSPDALLILVPRHKDRFDTIYAQAEKLFPTARRQFQQTVTSETAVYLGDTMGELLQLYATADAAFVGGSLIPRGGHNLLEPAALSKPIMSGPHLFNFSHISRLLQNADALLMVEDEETLAETLVKLANVVVAKAYGERACAVVEKNRGALAKQLAAVASVIDGRLGLMDRHKY